MADRWTEIPIDKRLFENLPEVVLQESAAALENCFINETGGHTRFWGLKRFTSVGSGRVYLSKFRDDLIATTSAGTIARVDRSGRVSDATGVPPGGGNRPVFTETDDQLVICNGGPPIQLKGAKSEILSRDAPESTHAGYIDGFLLLIEKNSQRFWNSAAGAFESFDPLDTFSAEGKPDNLTALVITENREVILAGPDSIEQFEPFPGDEKPFFRRWSVSEGLYAPYTLITGDGGTWGVTRFRELSRFAGPRKDRVSADINYSLAQFKDTDWREAWAAQLVAFGQRFILLQLPFATNVYGTEGVTLVFDYRTKKWAYLYGWDDALGLPARWPGWSVQSLWGRHFVGGEDGAIYELDPATHTISGAIQRMLFRSAHIDKFGEIEVEGVRIRCQRGTGSYTEDAKFVLRSRRDGKRWSLPQEKSLGRAGDNQFYLEFGSQGLGKTWQFEWWVTDDVPLEVVKLEILPARVN